MASMKRCFSKPRIGGIVPNPWPSEPWQPAQLLVIASMLGLAACVCPAPIAKVMHRHEALTILIFISYLILGEEYRKASGELRIGPILTHR